MIDTDWLLQAVLACPTDDLPRLIYADYLEEIGDATTIARAQFIRLQCCSVDDPMPVGERLGREQALSSRHLLAWLAPLRERGEALFNRGTHGLFRRGFVEVVWMPAAHYLWKADRLFAKAPVNELRVTRASLQEWRELLNSEVLARLTTLDFSDRRLGDDLVPMLANSKYLSRLNRLRLCNCNLSDEGAFRLADLPFDWFPTEIDLQLNCRIQDAGRAALRSRFGEQVLLSEPHDDA